MSKSVTSSAWVTAEEAYGRAGFFRSGLRALHLGYVVAVARDQQVAIAGQRHRIDVLAAKLPAAAWQTYSAGLGSKGPRPYRWAWVGIDGQGGQHSLLVRRSADGALAYYLAWHPTPVAFADLVAVACRRWIIEEAFQITKDQFGLDQTQVRSWHGWHRHTTLVMVAFALTALAIRDGQPGPAATPHDLTTTADPSRSPSTRPATSSPQSSSPRDRSAAPSSTTYSTGPDCAGTTKPTPEPPTTDDDSASPSVDV